MRKPERVDVAENRRQRGKRRRVEKIRVEVVVSCRGAIDSVAALVGADGLTVVVEGGDRATVVRRRAGAGPECMAGAQLV